MVASDCLDLSRALNPHLASNREACDAQFELLSITINLGLWYMNHAALLTKSAAYVVSVSRDAIPPISLILLSSIFPCLFRGGKEAAVDAYQSLRVCGVTCPCLVVLNGPCDVLISRPRDSSRKLPVCLSICRQVR